MSERLTMRHDNGEVGLVCCLSNSTLDGYPIHSEAECNPEVRSCEGYDWAINRLADYEDAMPLDRAQELAAAKRAGRLVVLPFAIGQAVFITQNTKGCADCQRHSQYCSGRYCPDPRIIERKFCYEMMCKMESLYATRAEARAALEAREGGKQ